MDSFFYTRSASDHLKEFAYVDDLTVCTTGLTRELANLRAQKWPTQDLASSRAQGLGLDKPAFMEVGACDNFGSTQHKTLRIGDLVLEPSSTLTMLGIEIEQELTGE